MRLTDDLARWWSRHGAIDLRSQLDTVQRLFAGERVYGADQLTDNHPPASYVLLWPLLGWLGLESARVAWALTTLPVLALLSWLAVRASGARTVAERCFMALTPVTMYATAITIGNGQLTIHVLAAIFNSGQTMAWMFVLVYLLAAAPRTASPASPRYERSTA
jgi:hypothetical protein